MTKPNTYANKICAAWQKPIAAIFEVGELTNCRPQEIAAWTIRNEWWPNWSYLSASVQPNA